MPILTLEKSIWLNPKKLRQAYICPNCECKEMLCQPASKIEITEDEASSWICVKTKCRILVKGNQTNNLSLPECFGELYTKMEDETIPSCCINCSAYGDCLKWSDWPEEEEEKE